MGANAQTTVPTFTAGQVLTADQQNQSARTGVPVFANTTTRDAGFGGTGEKTLAEGQLCYLEDSNVVQYYDGAAWATVGPQTLSSGLNFISGASFTAVASVSLANSTFTSTYRNYKVVFEGLASASSGAVTMRMRASGTDNTAASYYGGATISDITATARVRGDDGQTSFGLGTAYSFAFVYSFDLLAPQVAVKTKWAGTILTNISGGGGGAFAGWHNDTTQFDALSIIIAGGTTMTGTYRVYGYSDS